MCSSDLNPVGFWNSKGAANSCTGQVAKTGYAPTIFWVHRATFGYVYACKSWVHPPPAKTGYAPITFECIAQLLGALMRAKIGYTPAKTGYASTTFGYAARFLGMSMRAKVGYTPTKTGYALTTFGYTPQLLGTPMCAKVGYTPAKTGYTPTKVGYAVINDEQNTNEK